MAERKIPNSTTFPNSLLDDVMPNLKDTEWRVLCVVVRQTLGWRGADAKDRWRWKERDWISHSQLIRRTGRRSEAISAAVATLVSEGLIVVEDGLGNPLDTTEKRRRHLGRLYFRPGDKWITSDPARPQLPKRTTNTYHNIK